MSQVNIGGTTLSFKDSSFTGDQWESVASWVLNGGAEECETYAKEAKSYAKGGTATREGEDTDNAKYYKEQAVGLVADAQSSANAASASEINAETSKEAAAGFAANAKEQADRAEAASAHPPQISSDGYWELWDLTQSAYVKTTYPSRGPKGEGLKIDGTAPTYAQLPTLTESDAGKAYMVDADGRLYFWSGTAWPADGAGLPIKGEDGKSAYASAQDGGYTGTEDQFNKELAAVGDKANADDIPTQLSELTEDADHRLVTDTEKTTWNAKQDKIMANGFLRGDGAGNVTADKPVYIVPITISDNVATITSDDTHMSICEKLEAGYEVILRETKTSVAARVATQYICRSYSLPASDDITSPYVVWFFNVTNKVTSLYGSSVRQSSDSKQKTFTVSTQEFGTNPSMTLKTLTAAGWGSSDNSQVLEVSGVDTDEGTQVIIVSPATDSQSAYYAAGVRCVGQDTGQLTFQCDTIPGVDLDVYVSIQEVQ